MKLQTAIQSSRRWLSSVLVVLMLTVTATFATGCSSTTAEAPTRPALTSSYSQLELGNSTEGQDFGQWVKNTAQELASNRSRLFC